MENKKNNSKKKTNQTKNKNSTQIKTSNTKTKNQSNKTKSNQTKKTSSNVKSTNKKKTNYSNYNKNNKNSKNSKNQTPNKEVKVNKESIVNSKKISPSNINSNEEIKKIINTPKEKKKKRKIRKARVVIFIFILILLISLGYIATYFYQDYKAKKNSLLDIDNIPLDKGLEEKVEDKKSEKILKLEELQKENKEIIGWIEIEDTRINYPVVQTTDNDFYLTHDYKRQYSVYGTPFLDKSFDLENGSSNYLIYGHRAKNGLMFEDLYKYSKKDFYEKHTKINFTTLKEDATYEILAVFYSRVYYKNEKNVFRYYYFVNAKNEQEYNDYVQSAKKASIYDTKVDAKYGDQLLTLSTCEYSQEDGRFVVVAKKIEN